MSIHAQDLESARSAEASRTRGESDKAPTVLVVDDDEDTCTFLETALGMNDIRVVTRTSPGEALERFSDEPFDAVLTDLRMDSIDGLELCERIVAMQPDVPVIVVTGHGSMETAIDAIRAGAYDFITKPIDTKLLLLTVSRAVQHARLRSEVRRLRKVVDAAQDPGEIVGHSAPMRRVAELVRRVAESDATALLTGRSGTGKELVARAIHRESARKEGPFLAINCAAVPATLLESELFGHVKGAFTDAKSARTGLFLQADHGTLFLDEIGDLPLEVQPKILRALQERRVRPVGGSQEIPFDARIVAATNRDLEAEVAAKRFREDLYYRIHVVSIDLPSLKDRAPDIPLLAQHFVRRFAERSGKAVHGISASAAQKILVYDWPGNVRELENCIERAVALTRFDQITVEDLPEKIRDYRVDRLVAETDDPTELVPASELERRYVMRVLGLVGGNKSRAAEILGFDRRTLYRKLARYQRGNAAVSAGPAPAEQPAERAPS